MWLVLGQRQRSWTSINPTLGQRLVVGVVRTRAELEIIILVNRHGNFKFDSIIMIIISDKKSEDRLRDSHEIIPLISVQHCQCVRASTAGDTRLRARHVHILCTRVGHGTYTRVRRAAHPGSCAHASPFTRTARM